MGKLLKFQSKAEQEKAARVEENEVDRESPEKIAEGIRKMFTQAEVKQIQEDLNED